jgi:hypothetical protein
MSTPWYERTKIDHLLVGAVVAVHGVVVWRLQIGDLLMWAPQDHRAGLYRMVASTASLLLTVGAAAIGLYVGGGGRRLAWFRREHGPDGLAVMFSIVPALFGLVATAIVAYVVDVGGNGSWARWPVEYAILLSGWRLVRLGILYRFQLEGQLHDAVEEHQRQAAAAARR